MEHHTKTLGDLGVLKAQLDLFNKGYIIAVPLTEHAPFDLIIFKDGVCKTVQVKARRVTSLGNIQVQFRSIYSDSIGTHSVKVNKESIDIYCIYCPDTDKCYYFDPKKYKESITLRIEPSKNNSEKGINFAKDFYNVP